MIFDLHCLRCGETQSYDLPYNYKMEYIDHTCPVCEKHVEIHVDKEPGNDGNVKWEIKEPDLKTPPWDRRWHLNTSDYISIDI